MSLWIIDVAEYACICVESYCLVWIPLGIKGWHMAGHEEARLIGIKKDN